MAAIREIRPTSTIFCIFANQLETLVIFLFLFQACFNLETSLSATVIYIRINQKIIEYNSVD